MNIVFPKKSAYDFDRSAVAFPAVVDGVQHRVLVSQEALQDHFGAGSGDAQALVDAFEWNRPDIERVAEEVLRQGATGDVILKTAYF